jgi:tetratricopeptide (TPR) repeat protein
MLGVLKKLFGFRKPPRKKPDPDGIATDKWEADFSKPESIRFDIKSETSYDAYLRSDCLVLGLRKAGQIVWVEDPQFRYEDQVIRGKLRLDSRGAYAAAGFMFRMVDGGTYYSVLISNKGFFRLDVLRNGMPLALIGWTEIPSEPAPALSAAAELTIIAYGDHILIIINGRWAAEIRDSTIPGGRLCFTAASYEEAESRETYTAEAFLEALSVEPRIGEVEGWYEEWTWKADPLGCFRLAETFAAMDQPVPALIHLKKAWEIAAGDPEYRRPQQELLLAARLTLGLKLFQEAEEYINACIEVDAETPEGRAALLEKAKLLYMADRAEELKDLVRGVPAVSLGEDPTLYTLLGHACLSLGETEDAAAAYDRAWEQDPGNGLPAKNAANAYELLGNPGRALERYLDAGRAFLAQDNYGDLGLLIPKLLSLGAENRDAHGLAGKWAFGIEDWAMAEKEFAEAEKLRQIQGEAKDPAVVFLQGLLLIRKGKRRKAMAFLEEAVALAPDYPLFHLRLAENRFLLSGLGDPRLTADMEAALLLAPDDGWILNLAAQIALAREDADEASRCLEKAALSLGEVPAIRVNRAVLYYLRGSLDQALAVLNGGVDEDPEGIMANCAGNLLVRSGCYEEADAYYRKALAAAPGNGEYLCNRASGLIKLGLYGEADAVLARIDPLFPAALEMIAYVASKKGEYPRAEAACRAALELDPRHVPSLLSLGWIYSATGRWDKVEETLRVLEDLPLDAEAALRREELWGRHEDAVSRVVSCASCNRTWRVPRKLEPVPPLRFFAMPPDELPAGTCLQCGATYCIACGKRSLDQNGRFLCPVCGKPLKLVDEGLRKLVYDWAAGAIPREE